MSTFQVVLDQVKNPNREPDTSMNNGFSTSRTVTLTGPNGITRVLKDGQTFVDSNYFKKFCHPAMALEDAFLVCTVDDGSVYTGEDAVTPANYSVTVAGGTTYTDVANIVDVVGDHDIYGILGYIHNTGNQDVRVQVNDSVVLTLPADSMQVFDANEFKIEKLAFDNSDSGAISTTVEVLIGLFAGSST